MKSDPASTDNTQKDGSQSESKASGQLNDENKVDTAARNNQDGTTRSAGTKTLPKTSEAWRRSAFLEIKHLYSE